MKRWSWIVGGVAVLAAAVVAIVVLAGGDGSPDPGKVTASAGNAQREEGDREGDEEEAEREAGYFNPRKEAKFERSNGGEADRCGPDNPAAEQVENRAYPALATSTTGARSRRARHFDAQAAQARPHRRSPAHADVRRRRPPRRPAPGRRSGR